MTTRWDPFAVTHKKDLKNKQGAVVASVDYIGWSQAAERLDEAEDVARWSFLVVQVGGDWAHGRLTIFDKDGNEAVFENIGYAENADMDWKKEPLKDAVSDAFKRCAALAGVARYLYDTPSSGGRAAPPPARPSAPPRPRPVSALQEPDWMSNVPAESNGSAAQDVLDQAYDHQHDPFRPIGGNVEDGCRIHGAVEWRGTHGDKYHATTPEGKPWCREHPENVRKARRA